MNNVHNSLIRTHIVCRKLSKNHDVKISCFPSSELNVYIAIDIFHERNKCFVIYKLLKTIFTSILACKTMVLYPFDGKIQFLLISRILPLLNVV